MSASRVALLSGAPLRLGASGTVPSLEPWNRGASIVDALSIRLYYMKEPEPRHQDEFKWLADGLLRMRGNDSSKRRPPNV